MAPAIRRRSLRLSRRRSIQRGKVRAVQAQRQSLKSSIACTRWAVTFFRRQDKRENFLFPTQSEHGTIVLDIEWALRPTRNVLYRKEIYGFVSKAQRCAT